MSEILVTGAGAGLGKAIADNLSAHNHAVYRFDRKFGADVRNPNGTYGLPPVGLDVLINCAGINKTAWLEDLPEDQWDEVMDINAKGIYKMSRWALPELIKTRGTIINVVSNASHIPMTTSLAYNASKGAAHIMTLQMARELSKKHGITVFGISPNKLKGTEMSQDIEDQVVALRGWTPEYAQQYQLNALLAGEETDPEQLAQFVAYLLTSKAHHKYLTGCVIPYGA
jgi:meso-butanediol dehydrogenase/(S,S)-butanediol dehydrogenase/diacetyl reductase